MKARVITLNIVKRIAPVILVASLFADQFSDTQRRNPQPEALLTNKSLITIPVHQYSSRTLCVAYCDVKMPENSPFQGASVDGGMGSDEGNGDTRQKDDDQNELEEKKNAHYAVGAWVGTLKNGAGVLTSLNGFVYEGEFSKGLPNGRGKITVGPGLCFEGVFVDGLLQGQKKELRNRNMVYLGDTRNNKPHGGGLRKYFDKETNTYGLIEEGTFVDGKLHGWGKRTSKFGVTEGEYVHGAQTGWARTTFPSGKTVEGIRVDVSV